MIKLINSNSSFFSTFKTSTFNNGDTIPFYLGSPCFQQKVLQRATAQQLFYGLYESNSMDAINFLEQNGKFSPVFMDQLSTDCFDFLSRWDAFNPIYVDMFYTSFFGMPNPDPVMRRTMICGNPGAFNAFKMQRLMDMPTFKSFLMSKYNKQEIWNALPTPMDLIGNLISYPNMALRLMSSSQYYVIMQTFNSMTNTEFLTCFYQFRPQNYFSYVYSLGQLGSIFAKGYPIMTFMSDFARNNPSQIEALWNAMLGTYGQYYSSFQLSELDLYGAKRLGTIQDTLKLNSFYFNGSYNAANNSYNISSTFAPTYGASVNYYLTSFTYGKKQYEITNHLGNVLSTVSDYKLPYLNSSGKLCYNPDLRSENKYYAFGGAKDGFAAANSANNYSYGYQGSMKNNGLDGTINTFYRQGDVEGLFWLTYDSKSKASESGYILMGNNPILKNDILGDVDRPEFGGAINASFNLSSSSFRLSTSFGCSLKDGNKMGGLNVSFSMYNTGLGTNSGNSKIAFKIYIRVNIGVGNLM